MERARYLAREIRHLMRASRYWWLTPILVVFVVFGLVALLTEGATLLPLIYTLF